MPIETTIETAKKLVFYNIFVVIAAIVLFLLWNSVFVTESGYIYHEQNLLSGKVIIHTKPKINLRIPFSFRINRYTQAWTVNFGISYSGSQVRRKGPIQVRFADTYTAKIPATFRYKLPTDPKRIEMIHQEFRSFGELIDSLLIRTSRDVTVNTATQYTGEEFFLGGLNQFKAALGDQLRNGIYKTERKQVELEQMGLAPIGLEQEESMQMRKTTSLVWKTAPVLDAEGKIVRQENPLDPYGIEVTQITIGEPIAERQLETMLTEKKHLLAERIKAVQSQETNIEQAKTVQLQSDIERIRAKQEAIKHKELAIIAKQREIEEAKKQTEKEIIEYEKAKQLAELKKAEEIIDYEKAKKLAEIKKSEELAVALVEQQIRKAHKHEELIIAQEEQKIKQAQKDEELLIAKANQDINRAKKEAELIIAQEDLNIQKARFESAQYEAKAILEKGKAEAEVLQAMYEARIPEMYLAELQREVTKIMFRNLKGVTVTMPHNVVNLGDDKSNKLQTNLDVLSSFATIGVMEGLEKKALKVDNSTRIPPK